MTPGFVADEAAQILAAASLLTGYELALDQRLEALVHAPGELDAVDDRVEVLAAAVVVALLEVAKRDPRCVAWVGRPQARGTGAVVGVRLEHPPRKPVEVLSEVVGVAGVVTAKRDRQREDEEIRVDAGRARAPEVGGQRPVGRVRADASLPLVTAEPPASWRYVRECPSGRVPIRGAAWCRAQAIRRVTQGLAQVKWQKTEPELPSSAAAPLLPMWRHGNRPAVAVGRRVGHFRDPSTLPHGPTASVRHHGAAGATKDCGRARGARRAEATEIAIPHGPTSCGARPA